MRTRLVRTGGALDRLRAIASRHLRMSAVLPVSLLLTGFALRPATAQGDPTAAGIALALPGVDRVVVREGLDYKTVPTANGSTGPVALKLNVYSPPGLSPDARLPALIFVHGGVIAGQGPMPRRWKGYDDWGRVAAASGMIGVTFDHRMTVQDNVWESGSDVLDLIAYVRAHAGELHIAPDRLCLQFFSAGGPASSVVLRDPQPYLRCVVLYYPYLDLEHMRVKSIFRDAYPAAKVDSLLRYSPAEALTGENAQRLPPLFLARAGRDQIPGLNGSIERFMRRAIENNVTIDFAIHREGQHGFEFTNHDERSRQIIRESLAFVRQAVGLEGR